MLIHETLNMSFFPKNQYYFTIQLPCMYTGHCMNTSYCRKSYHYRQTRAADLWNASTYSVQSLSHTLNSERSSRCVLLKQSIPLRTEEKMCTLHSLWTQTSKKLSKLLGRIPEQRNGMNCSVTL